MSFGSTSLAVESMTPPNNPPPRLPRPPVIISADLRIMNNKKPINNNVGRNPEKLLASNSVL